MVGTDNWTGLVNLLGNVGFPVVLAIYLMSQFEKRIRSLEESIEELQDELANKKVKRRK
ncbi:YvrJ family protein [Fictibacillus sp. Mic-4]|uniref:YvrJ family protein n=1 Tax=Fictibacillus TaxID=1329200 RepID=UPI00040AF870|nr:YvrJ family protein [Fictibacillus gelatini]